MNDVDQRTGAFAEACWAFIRGQRASKPTAEEFGLHPFTANNVARLIGITAQTQRRIEEREQQQFTLETKEPALPGGPERNRRT